MQRDRMDDLVTFAVVARERSFTRAAAQLGVSASALSQTLRKLEDRLGIRLLTRTTRSVSPTEAGQRLLATILPRFDEIRTELDRLSIYRDTPAGTIRITASEYAAERVLWPRLAPVLRANPDITLEISIDHGFRDIVADGFDAGVRLGESVERDMIAVRIGPDARLVAVATPAYFATVPPPVTPNDLTAHRCINLRFVSTSALYAWEFRKGDQTLRARVSGQIISNSINACLTATLDGFGIGFLPEDLVAPAIATGALVQVLDDWSPTFPGLHLYYPSRRQTSPAFRLVLDALRYPKGASPNLTKS
ncbi:LysR family transcriptional regulator [Tabrizicola sp.]|uniref:LysR family transcriptional regulator n=1 Tax=Tabrizicola sp. TaxID=2005166 RepID=UPI0035B39166